MAATIDWLTQVISVPRTDMLLIQAFPEIRQLDVNAFRLELKAIEASTEGMPNLTTHNHNPPVTVAGTVLARVVEIINGYTVTFEDGQYRVILVGANNNILDVANLNQVSIAPTNSTGLQDLNSLQAASFGGVVSINVNSVYSGTNFPVGTREFPVNNVADAIAIAEGRGINTINVAASMTFASGDFSDGYVFQSDNPAVVTATLDPGTDVSNCEFRNITVTGTLDGSNTLRDCNVYDITYVSGFVYNCSLSGTVTLDGSGQASFFDCWSNVAGGGPGQFVTFDMSGTGQDVVVRNYSGGMQVENLTGTADMSIDMLSGRVTLDSTVTNGNFVIRGNAKVVDNSGGTSIVNDQTLTTATETSQSRLDQIIEDLEGELVTTSTLDASGNGTGTMILYTDATRISIIRQWTTVYTGFAVTERIPV